GGPEVRQQLAEEDVRPTGTHDLRRVDELPFTQGENLAAYQAGGVGPGEGGDVDDQNEQPQVLVGAAVLVGLEGGLDDRRQRDDEQQLRKGQEDVHDAREQVVDPAAEVARRHADHCAHDGGYDG